MLQDLMKKRVAVSRQVLVHYGLLFILALWDSFTVERPVVIMCITCSTERLCILSTMCVYISYDSYKAE